MLASAWRFLSRSFFLLVNTASLWRRPRRSRSFQLKNGFPGMPGASRRRARVERHHVTREYLAGLREDFVHVERLSRTLAALSPKVSRSLEWERVWLGLQFRSLYGLAWLRLQTGLNCRESLERLTNVVAYLASRADAVAAGLEQISAQSAGFGSTTQGGGTHLA